MCTKFRRVESMNVLQNVDVDGNVLNVVLGVCVFLLKKIFGLESRR